MIDLASPLSPLSPLSLPLDPDLPAVRIAPLERTHLAAAGQTLAASFAADPLFAAIIRDAKTRADLLRIVCAEGLRDALPFGAVDAALRPASDVPTGVAAWLPPGRFPLGPLRSLRGVPAGVQLLCRAPRSMPALIRVLAAMEHAHPKEPHWYLVVVGVEPGGQGRGVGSRLLAPGLARADRDRLPCYLETSTSAAVRFYERLGFGVVREEYPLGSSGPAVWGMRRPACPGVKS